MGVVAGADADPRTSASCIAIDNHHFGPGAGVDWAPGGIPAEDDQIDDQHTRAHGRARGAPGRLLQLIVRSHQSPRDG